jgi:hypothetical protein
MFIKTFNWSHLELNEFVMRALDEQTAIRKQQQQQGASK